MTGGFVITMKDTETDHPTFKTHFLILLNREKDKKCIFHTTMIVKQD